MHLRVSLYLKFHFVLLIVLVAVGAGKVLRKKIFSLPKYPVF